MNNIKKDLELGSVSFITKLAGFEHTEYIKPNATKEKINGDDVPMYIGMNIKNGRLTKEISWFLPKKISLQLHRSALTKKCLVLPYVGSVGDVAVFDSEERHHLASNVAKIELTDDAPFSPEYLYYFLKSPFGQRKLLFYIQGGVQKNITMDAIRKTIIPIQDNANKIVQILSDLDNKIELNNRINAELEAMAKMIYDYWFVQFDFPDKNGKPYKTSGGKMIWNEELKREIPEGWEIESIEKCCSIIDCLHSKKSDLVYENQQSYLLQLNNILDNGLIDLTDKYYVTSAEYKKWTTRIEVIDGDIVITNAGRVAATAQIPIGVKAGIGRNITAIRPMSICHTYLFLSFQGVDIQRQIKLNTDSGAFFTSFNVKGIKKLQLIRANKNLEEQFEKMVLPIRRRREFNNNENQKLTELRDWLLPMLMNGQVRVN